ncbi:TadE/TadG family type IV pilus assembly protein [Methylobacterium organophilum]|uniref:Putative Flp pilus-assembly TadG-like N-terminal domain-containing protein n=1 Tax=Methylobacterium organophilum TaxID=410 RepID=A0ABQ4T1E1_METOR|nr:pilus assembly protein TadG-related protein [Methylobacterium organophilum]GJE25455.1 hypothetical protein LKMONMHP_0293 [Methylobacterium organophilum]
MTLLSKALSRIRGLPRDRSGQMAVLFGIATIPLLCVAGVAIDYGRRSSAKVRLDAALDAALLSVVSQPSNTIDATALAAMQTQFRSEAAKIPGVTVQSFTPSVVTTASKVSLSASYESTIDTTLTKLMNFSSMKIQGTAAATRGVSQYIDFYLLLDNSPSMGLAATDADIAKMQAITHDKCAFACHKHTFDSKGNITGDDAGDYYHLAARYGIKLRIQVLRDAVMGLVDRAKTAMKLSQQYRMEVWTFSDVLTKVSNLTSNLDSTKSDATKIDLAYSLYGEPDNQTSYERALPGITKTIPKSGTGITPDSPIRFLFFVTDGVQDTPIDGSVSEPSAGYKINANRFISPLNPALCKTLKDNNVRIGIIYTMYLPLTSNNFYNWFVSPYADKIPTRLQSCASDGLFFPVSTDGDISAAMNKLFDTAVNSVRLTN